MTYKAELERIGDELHWTCHANLVTDKGCEFFNVTWTVPNAVDWLKTIASVSQTRLVEVTGDKGTIKIFQINFTTGEVKEVENE